ncbi:MAG: NmrA family NAD(P)-binding protein [Sutterellaceae bacterium]|nr:NmrA family NAD(P)-binding protein [Sutterellaceae bacterium]MDD7443094.1 NmrA family NAD(P)-binding protein [Sutterellaceae bacterium]MDY2867555.1 NmrA family NAD(P)-binding protein [Mesosutterella sp.]
MKPRILVTGVGGEIGSVSNRVLRHLIRNGYPVRAFMRTGNKRKPEIERMGAEVVSGDLMNLHDVARALEGVGRVFFSMSLNPSYTDAAVIMMEACRVQGGIEAFVNISEYEQVLMPYSVMKGDEASRHASLGDCTSDWSRQQRAHWAVERALEWSGLPAVNVRANIFVENPIIAWFPLGNVLKEHVLELPFGDRKFLPITAVSVAEAVAKILMNPEGFIGRNLHLEGTERIGGEELARMYSKIFGFEVTYRPVTVEEWDEKYMGIPRSVGLVHIANHLGNLGRLMAGGRYHHEGTPNDLPAILGHDPATGDVRKALESYAKVQEAKRELEG